MYVSKLIEGTSRHNYNFDFPLTSFKDPHNFTVTAIGHSVQWLLSQLLWLLKTRNTGWGLLLRHHNIPYSYPLDEEIVDIIATSANCLPRVVFDILIDSFAGCCSAWCRFSIHLQHLHCDEHCGQFLKYYSRALKSHRNLQHDQSTESTSLHAFIHLAVRLDWPSQIYISITTNSIS